MSWTRAKLFLTLAVPLCLCAQSSVAPIQAEIRKLDALIANQDLKLMVVAAMADSLQVHRNHLLLQRRETGQSFATIFVAELRSRGMDDDAVLRSLRSVRRDVSRQLEAGGAGENVAPLRPVLSVGSGVDHNSAATVFSLVSEVGFDSAHLAAVVGVPYYRISSSSFSSAGLGDAYVSGFLRGRGAGFDVGTVVTLGAPTGDRNKGLGTGKVTVDATGTIARRFGLAKPWLSAGFANSVFNNVGYLRPYITDGNVAHFGGGADFALPHNVRFGLAGFGLEPFGNQVVYSQTVMSGSNTSGNSSSSSQSGGMMPGGSMGPGMGSGGTMTMPPAANMPFYDQAQQTMIGASQLRDYGASIGLAVPLHAGISLNTTVARSVPFHLTTVCVGIGVDVAHLLFSGKH